MDKILDRIDLYLTEKKKMSSKELESLAKETIKNWQHDGGLDSGDIQSAVEDTAKAHGIDAEDFYTLVVKIAKKMRIEV